MQRKREFGESPSGAGLLQQSCTHRGRADLGELKMEVSRGHPCCSLVNTSRAPWAMCQWGKGLQGHHTTFSNNDLQTLRKAETGTSLEGRSGSLNLDFRQSTPNVQGVTYRNVHLHMQDCDVSGLCPVPILNGECSCQHTLNRDAENARRYGFFYFPSLCCSLGTLHWWRMQSPSNFFIGQIGLTMTSFSP